MIPGAFRIDSLQDEMTGVSLAGTQLRVNEYAMHDHEWNDIKVLTYLLFLKKFVYNSKLCYRSNFKLCNLTMIFYPYTLKSYNLHIASLLFSIDRFTLIQFIDLLENDEILCTH